MWANKDRRNKVRTKCFGWLWYQEGIIIWRIIGGLIIVWCGEDILLFVGSQEDDLKQLAEKK